MVVESIHDLYVLNIAHKSVSAFSIQSEILSIFISTIQARRVPKHLIMPCWQSLTLFVAALLISTSAGQNLTSHQLGTTNQSSTRSGEGAASTAGVGNTLKSVNISSYQNGSLAGYSKESINSTAEQDTTR